MTITKRTIGAVTFVIVLATFAYFMGLNSLIAKAAALGFSPSNCYTASATTSPAYINGWGTGTTTVSCTSGSDGANSAVLAVEVNGSSTASIVNINVEESMDGLDWFPITPPQAASTTNPFVIATRGAFQITFASSTMGGVTADTGSLGVSGTNNRNDYVIDVPVRMKRVRAYATIPAAANNAAVWMQIIPRQSIN